MLDPKDPVIVALNAKIDRNQAQLNGWLAAIIHGDPSHPNSQDAEAAHIAAVSAAIDKLQLSGIDPAVLAQEIANHVTLAAK